LGGAVDQHVADGAIQKIDRFEIASLVNEGDQVVVSGRRAGESTSITVDTIVNATGFRPDLEMLRELRLSLDEVVEAPRLLAPLIDPNVHSCGTVSPPWVPRAAAPRAEVLHRRDEELRTRPDLPARHRLRA